jgi:hypothetical protein
MIDIGFVTSANCFWLAMGMTTATGIFIGASIYDGNLSLLKKGILTILFYAFFIVLTTYWRISGNSGVPIFERHPQSTAGMITVIITTLFYIIGMIIGVFSVSKVLKGKHE